MVDAILDSRIMQGLTFLAVVLNPLLYIVYMMGHYSLEREWLTPLGVWRDLWDR